MLSLMKLKGRIIGNKLITPISKVFSKAKKIGESWGVMLGKQATGSPIENSTLAMLMQMWVGLLQITVRWIKNLTCVTIVTSHIIHNKTCWKLHGKPSIWKSSRPGDEPNVWFLHK
jgi:hypothetical protein